MNWISRKRPSVIRVFRLWWFSRNLGNKFFRSQLSRTWEFILFLPRWEAPRKRSLSSSGRPMWCSRFRLIQICFTFIEKCKCLEKLFFVVYFRLFRGKLKTHFYELLHRKRALSIWVDCFLELLDVLLTGEHPGWTDQFRFSNSRWYQHHGWECGYSSSRRRLWRFLPVFQMWRSF